MYSSSLLSRRQISSIRDLANQFIQMKTWFTLSLIFFAPFCQADEAVIEAAKFHVANVVKRDAQKLVETYSSKISLLPGHEYLKVEYDLAGPDGRDKGAEVDREKLIAAIGKEVEQSPARSGERVDALLKSLAYTEIKTAPGEFITGSSDPVGTPDKKLHFMIQQGDVLLKVSPPKGDYLLFQLRQEQGKWRVVAEYLD